MFRLGIQQSYLLGFIFIAFGLLQQGCGRAKKSPTMIVPKTSEEANPERPGLPEEELDRDRDCTNNFNCPEDRSISYNLGGSAIGRQGFYYEAGVPVNWSFEVTQLDTSRDREWGVGINPEKNPNKMGAHPLDRLGNVKISYSARNGRETGYINFILRDITRCERLSSLAERVVCRNMMVKTPWDVEFSVPYITDVNMIHPPDKKDLPPCTGNSGYYGDENAVSKVVRGIFNGGQACQD